MYSITERANHSLASHNENQMRKTGLFPCKVQQHPNHKQGTTPGPSLSVPSGLPLGLHGVGGFFSLVQSFKFFVACHKILLSSSLMTLSSIAKTISRTARLALKEGQRRIQQGPTQTFPWLEEYTI
jgi:hypothetical protein